MSTQPANTPKNQQQSKTREERIAERQARMERKMELAKEPGSRVFRAPAGPEMDSFLQLAQSLGDLYPRFKLQTGSFGSVGAAKSERIVKMMETICLNAAYLCEQIDRSLPGNHLPFRVPRAMAGAYSAFKKEMQAQNPQPPAKTPSQVNAAVRPAAVKKTERPAEITPHEAGERQETGEASLAAEAASALSN